MTTQTKSEWSSLPLILNNLEQGSTVDFIAVIGAVFDFYAGTKNRSSGFWIAIGLEWQPRFLKEPRRLWERNLKSTPIFLWWIIKEKIKQMLCQG